jgi:hypothetical protein
MRAEIGYMKFHVALITLIALLLLGGNLSAKEIQQKKEAAPAEEDRYYKWATGALASITLFGAYGEYLFIPPVGIKAIGLFILGADFNTMNRKEYIVSGTLAPVFHLIPKMPILDPVLMVGIVYSYHHWETRAIPDVGIKCNRTLRQGNLHDITFGGGFGLHFKFADRFKIGFDLWLNLDYSLTTSWTLRKRKNGRILLPLPILEFTVQF